MNPEKIFTEIFLNYMDRCIGHLKNYFNVALTVKDCILSYDRNNMITEYSALRHSLFYLERFSHHDVQLTMEQLIEDSHLDSYDILIKYSLIEFAWSYYLKKNQLDKIIPFTNDYKVNSAILRGICRSGRAFDARFVLMFLPISDYSPNLIREILTNTTIDKTILLNVFKQIYLFNEVEFKLILDLAAAFDLPVFSTEKIRILLNSNIHKPDVLLALLRYIIKLEMKNNGIVTFLHDLLLNTTDSPLSIFLANTLAILKHPDSGVVLERKINRLNLSVLLQTHLRTVKERIIGNSLLKNNETGIKLAQCVCFKGIHQDPGKGSSGGLGVFLLSLGDEIAKHKEISEVYTLVLMQSSECQESEPLFLSRTEKHHILRIPIYSEEQMNSYHMMRNDFLIEHTIEVMLRIYNISPDILHIRFSDDGSKVALKALKTINPDVKIAFTVTPEPLRRLGLRNFNKTLSEEEIDDIIYDLHNVFVADFLVNNSDGFILLPHRLIPHNITAYFPQILNMFQQDDKPLRVIPEGINPFSPPIKKDEDIFKVLTDQTNIKRNQKVYRLQPENLDRPFILNVGRLHPVKQHVLLLKAWIETNLHHRYNLVLIGGNHDQPSSQEKEILQKIYKLTKKNPEVRGRFCFLPAMPNSVIRQLENRIQKNNQVNIYIVSSLKEEFGIAALESLEAGFLLFNAKNSGLSYYIKDNETGYLINTSTLEEMKNDIVNVLNNYSEDQLRHIAKKGKQMCLEKFNIQKIAAEFVAFYLDFHNEEENK